MSMKLQNKAQRRKILYKKALKYYRKKPDQFTQNVLEIKLNFYQVLMMRAAFNAKFSCFVMSRGLGKSWLSMLILVVYCLLFSNVKAGIVAPSFRQSKKVLEEKYKDSICRLSPFVEQEEEKYTCSVQQAEVKFFNGSKITAFPVGSDGGKIRGARLNIVLLDEAFKVPRFIYEQVIKPMLVVKSDYKVGETSTESNNKVILASTAGYRTNWLYEVYVNWSRNMINGDKKYFVMSLPYTVGIRCGLYDKEIVEDAKRTMLQAEFEQEYCGIFSKLVDGAWINYDDLLRCADLMNLETKGVGDFEYIMAIDVARMEGEDNTIMMVFKLRWSEDHVDADLVYIRALNGEKFETQAQNVRELLKKFPNIIEIFMDTQTIGQGLADELAKDYYNEDEDKWYPPLIDMNDDTAMANIDKTHGVPIIYGIKPCPEVNHRCGYAIKRFTEKGYLHMYPENASEERYMKIGKDYSVEEQLLIKQSEATRMEVLNMETGGLAGGWMKFVTKAKRKDRWSALGYGLYGIEMLFEERKNKEDNSTAIFSVVSRR